MSALEDILKSFKRIDDENSPEYKEYAPTMKKFVADANAAVQSKGNPAFCAPPSPLSLRRHRGRPGLRRGGSHRAQVRR